MLRPVAKHGLVATGNASRVSVASSAALDSLRPRRLPLLLKPPAGWSLPVVTDPKHTSFPDRERVGSSWYPPAIAPILPDPANQDVQGGPFLFVFATVGGTVDDVALEAEIRIDVAVKPSAPADENSRDLPLDAATLEVRLLIPYLREHDNQLDHVPVEGSVVSAAADKLRLVFRPLNDAVRMAYGSLAARPPYDAHGCSVELTYAIPAYTPMEDRPQLALHELRRRAGLLEPLDAGMAESGTRPGIRISKSQRSPRRILRVPARGPKLDSVAIPRPIIPLHRLPGATQAYAQDVVRRTERFEIVAECSLHTTLYQQEDRATKKTRQVGCVDSLALGKAPGALFAEQGDLAVPGVFRVFRSLREQDVLLVLPAIYRLGRRANTYEPDGGWITSFSATPGELGNVAVLQAGVVPDIPAAALVVLQANAGPNARLVLPADRASEPPKVEWSSLDASTIAAADASVDAAGFAVTLETVFANTPVVRQMLAGAGVSADITFTFADGSTLPSALNLTAAELAGPWPDGPVRCTVTGGDVTVTNHGERPVLLQGVLPIFGDGGTGPRFDAVAELPPGASTTIPAPDNASGAVAVFEVRGAGPELLPQHLIVLDDLYTIVTIGVADAVFVAGVATVDGSARIQGSEGAVSFLLEPDRRQVLLSLSKPIAEAAVDSRFVIDITVTTADARGTTSAPIRLTRDLSAGVVLFLEKAELGIG